MQAFLIAVAFSVLAIFLYYILDLVPRLRRENADLEKECQRVRDLYYAMCKERDQWFSRYMKGDIDYGITETDNEE